MASVIVPGVDLAPSLPSRVVTVELIDVTESTAVAGAEIDFFLPGDLHVPADDVIVQAGKVTLTLDESGKGRVRLPAYTDTITPSDWVIGVKKRWAPHPYFIRVPAGSTAISLADIPAVQSLPAGVVDWMITGASVTVTDGAQWNASLNLIGGILNLDLTVPPGGTAWARGALTENDNLDMLRSTGQAGAYSVPRTAVAEALELPDPDQGILRTYWVAGGQSGTAFQEWRPLSGAIWTRSVQAGSSAQWKEWKPALWERPNLAADDDLYILRDSEHAGLYPVPSASVASALGLPESIQGSLLVLPTRHNYVDAAATQLWFPRRGNPYFRSVGESNQNWTSWEALATAEDLDSLSNAFMTIESGAQLDGAIAAVNQLVSTGRLSENSLSAVYATKSELSEVATGDPVAITDVAVAAAINDGTSTRNAIDEVSLSRDGGTLHGDLHLETPPNQRSNRVILEAWERSNPGNNRAGDVMELRWRTPYAKAFIGWWDYTNPSDPKMKAWMGAHDLQNNPDPNAPPHQHWSIEVADEATGAMQTRLAIPYGRDHTNITTSSADFTVGWGVLRVAQGPLEFAAGAQAEPEDRRWSINPAGGSDYDLQIRCHDNNGVPQTIARMHRETARFALGGNFTAERLLHVRHASQAMLVEGTASSGTGLMVLRHMGGTQRVLQAEVAGDSFSRFSLTASGAAEWGTGDTPREMHLAPHISGSNQRQLRVTGADIRVMDQGRGLILADSETGDSYRLRITNGEVTLVAL